MGKRLLSYLSPGIGISSCLFGQDPLEPDGFSIKSYQTFTQFEYKCIPGKSPPQFPTPSSPHLPRLRISSLMEVIISTGQRNGCYHLKWSVTVQLPYHGQSYADSLSNFAKQNYRRKGSVTLVLQEIRFPSAGNNTIRKHLLGINQACSTNIYWMLVCVQVYARYQEQLLLRSFAYIEGKTWDIKKLELRRGPGMCTLLHTAINQVCTHSPEIAL